MVWVCQDVLEQGVIGCFYMTDGRTYRKPISISHCQQTDVIKLLLIQDLANNAITSDHAPNYWKNFTIKSHSLSPPKSEVMFSSPLASLFAYLFVRSFVNSDKQKLLNRFSQNSVERWHMSHGRSR